MIFEIWWFNPTEEYPKREYRCAMPSLYGEANKITTCVDRPGSDCDHVCYIEAATVAEAMQTATARHPDWTPLPVDKPVKTFESVHFVLNPSMRIPDPKSSLRAVCGYFNRVSSLTLSDVESLISCPTCQEYIREHQTDPKKFALIEKAWKLQ